MDQYAKYANKKRKKLVFAPGDWVWVHMRKERFPLQRKSKLLPRGDGPFQVLEKINDNAYKIDLPGDYNVSATFNVSDLSPFDIGHNEDSNSRSSSLEEGEYDEDQGALDKGKEQEEDLKKFDGPMTRAKAKKLQEAIQKDLNQALLIRPNEDLKMINLIQISEACN